MSVVRTSGLNCVSKNRRVSLWVAATLAAWLLAGCAGQTVVEQEEQAGPYRVDITVDPKTLNPPATASLSFEVTDAQTNKPVVNFDPISRVLLHNVVISADLLYFRHDYASQPVANTLSVFTYFPELGGYYNYTLYKPAGDRIQLLRTNITAGTEGEHGEVHLVEGPEARTRGWVTVQLLTGPERIRKGQPTQLVFHATQRGQPLTNLWPFLGAPGHLWLVDDHGHHFTHLEGTADWRRLLPTATLPPAGTRTATPIPVATTVSGSSQIGGGMEATMQAVQAITPSPVPTLVEDVQAALATINAMPTPAVAPVQQTAQTSVLSPYVLPEVGYGPNIVFTHTFPEAGTYKMWLEIVSSEAVLNFDFVVRVEE